MTRTIWRGGLFGAIVVLIAGLVVFALAKRASDSPQVKDAARSFTKPALKQRIVRDNAPCKTIPNTSIAVAVNFLYYGVLRKNPRCLGKIVPADMRRSIVPYLECRRIPDWRYDVLKGSTATNIELRAGLECKNGTHPQIFRMTLTRTRGRWQVTYWMPDSVTPVPSAN